MGKFYILSLKKDLGFSISTINPVAIEDNFKLVLFDAGYPNQLIDLAEEIKRIGFSISDIKAVVVSHHDHDHIGSLKELKDAYSSIEVICGELESKYISGAEVSLRLAQAMEYNKKLTGNEKAFGEQFANYLQTISPCEIDRVVRDNEYICKGVQAISTPGHTPGHISLFLEEESTLLAGDALAIENGKLVLANPQFTLDMQEAVNTIKKIMEMNIHRIICYHGNEFYGDIKEGLRNIISTYEHPEQPL